jgi:hypothetical protein
MILGLPDPHSDPLVRGTDPRIRIRIRIRTKISRIPNTGSQAKILKFLPLLSITFPKPLVWQCLTNLFRSRDLLRFRFISSSELDILCLLLVLQSYIFLYIFFDIICTLI